MTQDPYSVLGVPRSASQSDIKAAFRKLAKQHHPDLNRASATAEAKFRAGSEAYELLSKPARRARFDRGDIDAAGKPSARPPEPEKPDTYVYPDETPASPRPRYRPADSPRNPYVPQRASPSANWGAVAITACLLACMVAARLDHSWRGSLAMAWCGIVLALFLIRWTIAGLQSLRLDGPTLGCVGLALLLGIAGIWTFLDKSLNFQFAHAGYPPFFGDFVGLVCLSAAVLLCLPHTRRFALAGFAAFLLAGCILGVLQGQATQVRVTLIVLPVCFGLLLASEPTATHRRPGNR